MSEFDHIDFNRLLADLALQPLSRIEIELLRDLSCGGLPLVTRDNTLAAERLGDLGLVDDAEGEWDDEAAIEATAFLDEICARGLLAQLSTELA